VFGIFQLASNCQENLLDPKCSWQYAANDLASKIWQTSIRAFMLKEVLLNMSEDCKDDQWGWPFTQQCQEAGICNYYYGLAIPRSIKNGVLNQLPSTLWYELDESYYQSTSQEMCEREMGKWEKQYGFALGGLYGYNDDESKLKLGTCSDVTNYASSGYIILGAIPSFCIPDYKSKCQNNVSYDELWGFNL